MNVQGQVRTISTKEWYDDKKGQNINLYSFQLDGNNKWFRTGTNRPPCNEGDSISFDVNEKGNVNINSLKPSQGGQSTGGSTGQPSSNSSARQQSSSGGGQSRDGYWSAKEANDKAKDERYQSQDIPRMSFSAAQDRAVQLVSAALTHDCLAFGNMKKGDKLDYVLGCVDEVTDRFLVQTMGAGEHFKSLQSGATESSGEKELGEVDRNDNTAYNNNNKEW